MTTAHQIHPGQWITENKVIRPYITGIGNSKRYHEIDFESFAKQHAYATDLDGTYNADDLGEVVWQYTNYADKSVWSYATNPQAHKDFEAYSKSCPYPTRKFLTLKPHPMSKETIPTPGLQVDDTWYYLDEDCNAKVPNGHHCECCKRPIKATQSFETFKLIVKHPTEYPPLFRLASPTEKSVLIGSHCFDRVVKEYGIIKLKS